MCVCFGVGGELKKKIIKLNIFMCFYFFFMFVVEVESLCLRLIEKISINIERKLLLFYILLFFVVLEVR